MKTRRTRRSVIDRAIDIVTVLAMVGLAIMMASAGQRMAGSTYHHPEPVHVH